MTHQLELFGGAGIVTTDDFVASLTDEQRAERERAESRYRLNRVIHEEQMDAWYWEMAATAPTIYGRPTERPRRFGWQRRVWAGPVPTPATFAPMMPAPTVPNGIKVRQECNLIGGPFAHRSTGDDTPATIAAVVRESVHMARGSLMAAPVGNDPANAGYRAPDEDETWHPGAIDATGSATPMRNTWRDAPTQGWSLGDIELDHVRWAHHGPIDKRFGFKALPMPIDTTSPLARVAERGMNRMLMFPDPFSGRFVPIPVRVQPLRRHWYNGPISGTVFGRGAVLQFLAPSTRQANHRGMTRTTSALMVDALSLRAALASNGRRTEEGKQKHRQETRDKRHVAILAAAEWCLALYPDAANLADLTPAYRAVAPRGPLPAWLKLAGSIAESSGSHALASADAPIENPLADIG